MAIFHLRLQWKDTLMMLLTTKRRDHRIQSAIIVSSLVEYPKRGSFCKKLIFIDTIMGNGSPMKLGQNDLVISSIDDYVIFGENAAI